MSWPPAPARGRGSVTPPCARAAGPASARSPARRAAADRPNDRDDGAAAVRPGPRPPRPGMGDGSTTACGGAVFRRPSAVAGRGDAVHHLAETVVVVGAVVPRRGAAHGAPLPRGAARVDEARSGRGHEG